MHLVERAAQLLRGESGIIEPIANPFVDGRPPRPPAFKLPVDTALPAGSEDDVTGTVAENRPAELSHDVSDAAPLPKPLQDPLHGLSPAGMRELVREPVRIQGKITDSGQVEGALAGQLGRAGNLLDMSKLERGGLVVGRKSRTRISEEFRIAVGHVLRSLQTSYTAGHGSANLIMVTSSRPGEGKSFSAINLAGCIAQQNQREVLLVDIDAKQRPVTFDLGLGEAPGLLDLVRDPSLRIEDVIVPTSIPSLSFLPIGSRVSSNAEMPLSRPISAVIERLGRRYANRVIILDAPPCLSTSDPSALAPIVGQILMVVEAERTQRNELIAALELVRVCPTITLLLNKIQLTTSYTFGAYHYFGTYS